MDLWPRIVEMVLTPPGIVLVLLALTFLAYLKKHWMGAAMLAISLFTLVALSLPRTGQWLLADLQGFSSSPELVRLAESGPQSSSYVPKASIKDPPQAIVVLGANRNHENGDDIEPRHVRLRVSGGAGAQLTPIRSTLNTL